MDRTLVYEIEFEILKLESFSPVTAAHLLVCSNGFVGERSFTVLRLHWLFFFLFAPEAIDKDTESNLQLLDCNSAALKTLLIKELGKSLLGW